MATYSVNINKTISNVKVCVIKKSVRGDTNRLSKIVEALIQKYILKEKAEGNK
jgi:hypothetical protein